MWDDQGHYSKPPTAGAMRSEIRITTEKQSRNGVSCFTKWPRETLHLTHEISRTDSTYRCPIYTATTAYKVNLQRKAFLNSFQIYPFFLLFKTVVNLINVSGPLYYFSFKYLLKVYFNENYFPSRGTWSSGFLPHGPVTTLGFAGASWTEGARGTGWPLKAAESAAGAWLCFRSSSSCQIPVVLLKIMLGKKSIEWDQGLDFKGKCCKVQQRLF